MIVQFTVVEPVHMLHLSHIPCVNHPLLSPNQFSKQSLKSKLSLSRPVVSIMRSTIAQGQPSTTIRQPHIVRSANKSDVEVRLFCIKLMQSLPYPKLQHSLQALQRDRGVKLVTRDFLVPTAKWQHLRLALSMIPCLASSLKLPFR